MSLLSKNPVLSAYKNLHRDHQSQPSPDKSYAAAVQETENEGNGVVTEHHDIEAFAAINVEGGGAPPTGSSLLRQNSEKVPLSLQVPENRQAPVARPPTRPESISGLASPYGADLDSYATHQLTSVTADDSGESPDRNISQLHPCLFTARSLGQSDIALSSMTISASSLQISMSRPNSATQLKGAPHDQLYPTPRTANLSSTAYLNVSVSSATCEEEVAAPSNQPAPNLKEPEFGSITITSSNIPSGAPTVPLKNSVPHSESELHHFPTTQQRGQSTRKLSTLTTFHPCESDEGIKKQHGAEVESPVAGSKTAHIAYDEAVQLLYRERDDWPEMGLPQSRVASRKGLGALLGCCTTDAVAPVTSDSHAASVDAGFVHALKTTNLDRTNPVHNRILCSLYSKLTSDITPDSHTADCGRVSLPDASVICWDRIGFQGADPASDLRSTGILGLLQALYLVEYFPALTKRLWAICNPNTADQELPFVLICFNFSGITMDAWQKGFFDPADAPAPSRSNDEMKTHPTLHGCNEFYVGCHVLFMDAWMGVNMNKGGTASVADFGPVKAQLRSQILRRGGDQLVWRTAARTPNSDHNNRSS